MDEHCRAYLAGYFDGEGCVSASKSEKSHPVVKIVFTQRDRAALERVRAEFGGGGTICQLKSGVHQLRFSSGKDVKHVIRTIYPFVRQKREHLLVAYAMVCCQRTWGDSRPLSSRHLDRRYSLAERISALNCAGRANGLPNRRGKRVAVGSG